MLCTIALGIGGNIVVYGFVRGLIASPFPAHTLDRIVSVFGGDPQRPTQPLSYQEYRSLKQRSDVFDWVGAARVSQATIRLAGQSPNVSVAAVTPELARLLNLALGDGVVISHQMQQREFGATSDVRGQQLGINGVKMGVEGVAPDWLEGVYRDRTVDLWTTLREGAGQQVDVNRRTFWVVGRLRSGLSMDQAQKLIGASGGAAGPIRMIRYTGITPDVADSVSRVGLLLSIAASAVFFIACGNVASFSLGRASTRSQETSLRIALGANRTQIIRGLLADAIVISVSGALSGMLLALWTSRIVPALLFEEDAQRLKFAPDLLTVVVASAACAGVTILCGLLPALAIPHDRPADILRRESAGPSPAAGRLRAGLVVAQMASCCVLVITSAFLLDGFRNALQTKAGHRLGHPILVQARADGDAGISYFQHVDEAARAVAGISETAWTGRMPGSQPAWQSFRIESQEIPLREVTLDRAWFTDDSLALFSLPPKSGRLFNSADHTCQAAIVNEEAAAELFGDSTAGRSVQDPAGLPAAIVGVVVVRGRSQPAIYYFTDPAKGPPGANAPVRFRTPIVSSLASADLDTNVVSPSYFAAMGLSLISGRLFPNDLSAHGCRIGVINQEAADLYFAGKAVGATVIDDNGTRTKIIGVVNSPPLGGFQRRAEPAIYFPMAQDLLRRMTLIGGAREVNDLMLADLRRRIESVSGHSAPIVIQTLDAHLSQTALAPLRIATTLIGACAAIGLLLSVLGLYGALSDSSRQQRRELAIRIALGAQRRHVIWQVLSEGGRLACVGMLAGLLGSVLLSRLLASVTLSSSFPALWVWLAAPLALALSVATASILPSRRALILNPLNILRDDN